MSHASLRATKKQKIVPSFGHCILPLAVSTAAARIEGVCLISVRLHWVNCASAEQREGVCDSVVSHVTQAPRWWAGRGKERSVHACVYECVWFGTSSHYDN